MGITAYDNDQQERLLRALAEQLKLPLLQIAREAEFAESTGDISALKTITNTADMALKLVDSYLLSIELQALPNLQIEPVSVSAMLQDTAHELNQLAREYNCDLQVDLKGKYQPVMAHRRSLEAAFASLGYAFIEAAPADNKRHTVILGAHQSSYGLVAGVFGDQPGLNADALKRGNALYGTARQSLPGLSSSAGAGVFVANSLLTNIEAPLKLSRHNKLSGLASTLLASKQMALI